MSKVYIIVSLGVINLLCSLGNYIVLAKEAYENDGWGHSFKADGLSTYMIWMISSVLIIALGYIMYKEEKKKEVKEVEEI